MKGRLNTVLALAGMLGIGGVFDHEPHESSSREPAEVPERDERIERIFARSREDQNRKQARRKARWKSEAGKRA